MVYVFILAIWMLMNCIAQVINDISISIRNGKKINIYISIIGQTMKYATWAWLIYKISQEF